VEKRVHNTIKTEKRAKVGKEEICGKRAARARKGCIMYSRETRREERRQ